MMAAFLFAEETKAATITTLTIKEKDGVTTNNYPLTFGHVFKKGDVGPVVSVKIGENILPTQVDAKRHYEDGSMRFAVISVVIPVINANENLNISLVTEGGNQNAGEMLKDNILATDVQSLVELSDLSDSNYSNSRTANLRTSIESEMNLKYWLKGSVATEIITTQEILDDSLNPQLNAKWEVRFYPGTSFGPRISNTIENVNSQYRGNVDYAVNIKYGNSNPIDVYTKNTFQHNINSRWRKVIWLGAEPPEVELKYDLPYMISTGAIMSYDTSLVVPENVISSAYSGWQVTDHDIMGKGNIQTYFPTTGGRQDIGVLPTWTARYLISMDNRMREIMLGNAEMAASTPVHHKEMDIAKSFYGHPISIDDRPTVWLGNNDYSWTAINDRLPVEVGSKDTIWTIDRAHQGSFAFIPYLITGDFFYLEEMYYWASFNLGASNFNSEYGRDYAYGLIRDQVRGEAWAIRNIADAAAFAIDDDIEKTYLEEKVNNNLEAWIQEYINSESSPLHIWGGISCRPSDGGRGEENIVGCTASPTGKGSGIYEDVLPMRYLSSPWMDDYVLTILSHLEDLRYNSTTIKQWLGKFVVDRFTHPEFNPYEGAPYRLAYEYTLTYDAMSPSYYVQDWAHVYNSIISKTTSFPTDDYPTSYRYIAMAAASQATEIQNGQQAYLWLKSNVEQQNELNDDPTWAFVPKTIQNIDNIAPASPSGLRVE